MTPTTIEKSTAPEIPICVIIEMRGVIVAGPGIDAWCNMFQTVICRALRDKGILGNEAPSPANGFATDKAFASVFSFLNQTLGVFTASELGAGLRAIRAELERVALLPFAQIGWHDYREGVWMRDYPAGIPDSFPDPLALIRKWKGRFR